MTIRRCLIAAVAVVSATNPSESAAAQAMQPPALFDSLMRQLSQAGTGGQPMFPHADVSTAATGTPATGTPTGPTASSLGLPDPSVLMRMLSQPTVGAAGVGAAQQPDNSAGLFSALTGMGAAGAGASSAAAMGGMQLPPPLQAMWLLQQGMGGGMPQEMTDMVQTVGSAVNGARSMVDSVQAAEQYFKPQQLVQDAIHAVQDLPDGVKAQVREKAEDLLKDVPVELTDFLKTQMGTLIERLPAHMKNAFSERPDYLLEHGSELVANLTQSERDDLLKTTRSVVSETMKHALAKPDALLTGITKLIDSLPPEFTNTVTQMQGKMLQQAEQVVQHLPAGLLSVLNQAAPGVVPPTAMPPALRAMEGQQAEQSRSTIMLGAQPTSAVTTPATPAAPSFMPGIFPQTTR